MYSSRSVALHRAAVAVLAVSGVAIAVVQARALWALAGGIPVGRSVQLGAYNVPDRYFINLYGSFVASACFGVFALFMSWKVPRRLDARLTALLFGIETFVFALVVVPSGGATWLHRAVYSVAFGCACALILRFCTVFPKVLSLTDLAALGASGSRTGWRRRLGEGVRQLQGFVLSHAWVYGFVAALFAGLSYFVAAFAVPYFLMGDMRDFWWVHAFVLLPLMIGLVALAVSFLWSGYRLAGSEERARARWIVLGAAVLLGFFGLMFAAILAWHLTGIQLLASVVDALIDVFVPVHGIVLLTGFGMAILYSGAFDVRPLINKTTVYGTLSVLFIILFAVVESLVSEVIEARLGLPNMLGAGLSGALVAAIVLPLRGRFAKRVSRWMASAEGQAGAVRMISSSHSE